MNETRTKLLNTSQAWVWAVLLVAVLSVGFYHAGVGAATGLLVSVRSPGLSLPYPPDRRLLRRWCISGALPLRNRAASIASIRAAACASPIRTMTPLERLFGVSFRDAGQLDPLRS